MRTPRGTIATRAVVDAAGAWARVVAAGLGGGLPVVPTRHRLLITEPIAGVGPEFPITPTSTRATSAAGSCSRATRPIPCSPTRFPTTSPRCRSTSRVLGTTATSWGRCLAWPASLRGRRRGTSPRPTRRGEAIVEGIAERVVDGAPALDLSEISPARFAGREVDEAELRERCRRAYATHYRAGSETPAGP